VQLRQGRTPVLSSIEDPRELARRFNRYGEVAVIDLDAAMGTGNNRELIRELCQLADVRVGGGIRDLETAREYLRAGAARLIIGTSATPEFLRELPAERIIVALDNVGGEVVDQGWQNRTGEQLLDRAKRLAPYCAGFLVTYVDREGTRQGLPVEVVKTLKETMPRPVTAAGGVSGNPNAVELLQRGVDLQVGMSLYTGMLDPTQVFVESLDWRKMDLIPTIARDTAGQVLMLAYSNRESLAEALEQGAGIYYSRSRREIWQKGATSGNRQKLLSVRWDCDKDSLLFTVEQTGPACHTGDYSCFGDRRFSLRRLENILVSRRQSSPETSYTARLLADEALLDAKLREETDEVINFKDRRNLVWELADLTYFTLVKAVANGISLDEILSELKGRHK
jgi:phosphoribosyl-ATP pyrophosphohydrolase